jgi:hypothetical protein
VLFLRSIGVRSLSLLPRGLLEFEGRGLVYSGGGCDSCTPNPTLVVVVAACWGAATEWLDSPGSSFDGMWVRCAKDISVGERTGPGLAGG